MPTALAILVGLAALLLALPERYIPFRPRHLRQQFTRMGGRLQRTEGQAGPKPLPAFRLAERVIPAPLIRPVAALYGEHRRERFRQQVIYAGLEGRLTWRQFLALKAAIPILGGLYLGLLFLKDGLDPALVAAAPIPLLGFFVPDQWLSGRVKRRQQQMERELPAVLTTLAISTEAGLVLSAAMEEVARTESGTLAGEFRWASEQITLGVSQGEALERMAARCGVPDLTIFISMLVQSFEKGAGQVSATLRTQSQEAWAKRKRRADELAQTASVRLFLPLVLLVFPAVMIFLLGPALMTISDFFMSNRR